MQFIIKSVSTPYIYIAVDTIAHTFSGQTYHTADEALANIHTKDFNNSDFNDVTDTNEILHNLKSYIGYTFDSFVSTQPTPYEFW